MFSYWTGPQDEPQAQNGAGSGLEVGTGLAGLRLGLSSVVGQNIHTYFGGPKVFCILIERHPAFNLRSGVGMAAHYSTMFEKWTFRL